MSEIISEENFREALCNCLPDADQFDFVTGPGRSGAIASVYASHFLGIPFVPYKMRTNSGRALIVDTATQSGRTLRKAARLYGVKTVYFAYQEPPRVRFWYEELSLIRGIGKEYLR